ncbi:AGZA family xanthine/uracil permease-like MFS transporter [Luteibacter sp. HA06]
MATNLATRRRFGGGDLNGVLGLVVDNLSLLAFMATALIGIFGMPADIVFRRMFPGTALGVLLGNLAYTWMARRLAARTGREDVTAMPLGIDAPTTIGMALLVLGPAFAGYRQAGMDPMAAGEATWHLGMASLVVMGVLKFVLSFFGAWVQRSVPRAGLLGSIAGIALVLMGFLPLVEILRVPVVGFAGLGVVLYALVAKRRLPFGLPGVLGAFIVGVVLYYGLGPSGFLGSGYHPPGAWQWRLGLPLPTLGFIDGLPATVPYLPLILPFGLLMVVGGINVTESARAAGDDYPTRDILLVEALATLIAGMCGGVAQTTPYIGQPAYKAMGARTGYTLVTGLVIGLGGIFGYLANLVELLPVAVLAPILVFISISITTQAFEATPLRYAAAVVFSFFPAIARMLAIKLGDPSIVDPAHFAALYGDASHGISAMAVIVILGNGFIITSMVWASFVVAMIDGEVRKAAGIVAIGAVLTAFGIIHSVEPIGSVYLPWALDPATRALVWQFVAAYGALAVVLFLLSIGPRRR